MEYLIYTGPTNNFRTYAKFLWLPETIDGFRYWLETVAYAEELVDGEWIPYRITTSKRVHLIKNEKLSPDTYLD